MVSGDQLTVVNAKVVMRKIVHGDGRMPTVIATDLGLVGDVVVSDIVRSTVAQTIAQNTAILDECIRESDTRPTMVIVGMVMNTLNPNNRWDTIERIGDPVIIKNLVMEALEKRRNEKR